VQGDSDEGGSDAEMADAGADGDGGEDDEGDEGISEVAKPPPKKKAKTSN